jgi:hypothetical protein
MEHPCNPSLFGLGLQEISIYPILGPGRIVSKDELMTCFIYTLSNDSTNACKYFFTLGHGDVVFGVNDFDEAAIYGKLHSEQDAVERTSSF